MKELFEDINDVELELGNTYPIDDIDVLIKDKFPITLSQKGKELLSANLENYANFNGKKPSEVLTKYINDNYIWKLLPYGSMYSCPYSCIITTDITTTDAMDDSVALGFGIDLKDLRNFDTLLEEDLDLDIADIYSVDEHDIYISERIKNKILEILGIDKEALPESSPWATRLGHDNISFLSWLDKNNINGQWYLCKQPSWDGTLVFYKKNTPTADGMRSGSGVLQISRDSVDLFLDKLGYTRKSIGLEEDLDLDTHIQEPGIILSTKDNETIEYKGDTTYTKIIKKTYESDGWSAYFLSGDKKIEEWEELYLDSLWFVDDDFRLEEPTIEVIKEVYNLDDVISFGKEQGFYDKWKQDGRVRNNGSCLMYGGEKDGILWGKTGLYNYIYDLYDDEKVEIVSEDIDLDPTSGNEEILKHGIPLTKDEIIDLYDELEIEYEPDELDYTLYIKANEIGTDHDFDDCERYPWAIVYENGELLDVISNKLAIRACPKAISKWTDIIGENSSICEDVDLDATTAKVTNKGRKNGSKMEYTIAWNDTVKEDIIKALKDNMNSIYLDYLEQSCYESMWTIVVSEDSSSAVIDFEDRKGYFNITPSFDWHLIEPLVKYESNIKLKEELELDPVPRDIQEDMDLLARYIQGTDDAKIIDNKVFELRNEREYDTGNTYEVIDCVFEFLGHDYIALMYPNNNSYDDELKFAQEVINGNKEAINRMDFRTFKTYDSLEDCINDLSAANGWENYDEFMSTITRG